MATVSKKVFSLQETETFYKFKIKIVSLAEEARYIRKHERKLRAMFNRRKMWLMENPEATKDEKLQHLGGEFLVYPSLSLRCHRVEDIRQETRSAILARAFWMNRDYTDVESRGSREFNYKRVAEIVSSISGRPTTKDEIYQWSKA